MRIAICLSGQLRDWQITYHSFIDKLPPCDIFVSTWADGDSRDFDDVVCPVTIERNDFQKFQRDHAVLISECYYRGSRFAPEKACEDNSAAALAMFFNIWNCNELKKNYEREHGMTYDLVIRLRSELEFFDPRDLDRVLAFQNVRQRIYLPRGFEWGGVTDLFAFGSSASMDRYSSIWKCFSTDAGGRYEEVIDSSETLLLKHLKLEAIDFKKLALNIRLRGERIYMGTGYPAQLARTYVRAKLPRKLYKWLCAGWRYINRL